MAYRLFFAIWPGPQAQRQIQQLLAHSQWPTHSKPIPAVDWHLTLRFLGKASEQQYQELLPLIAQIKCPAFNLILDRLVYWSAQELLLLEPTTIPQPLTYLVKQLNSRLKPRGWKIEGREYKPHLTLARHFPDPFTQPNLPMGLLATPVACTVNSFCLADGHLRNQGKAAHYRILQDWKL